MHTIKLELTPNVTNRQMVPFDVLSNHTHRLFWIGSGEFTRVSHCTLVAWFVSQNIQATKLMHIPPLTEILFTLWADFAPGPQWGM